MLDLVLKAQGKVYLGVSPFHRTVPKILTDMAYLSPLKFKIAEFLKENPDSSAKNIREAIGVPEGTINVNLLNMTRDNHLNKTELKNSKYFYSYTLSVREFKTNKDIKSINKKEKKALFFLKNIGTFTSHYLAAKINVPKYNIYYLINLLLKKGLIKVCGKAKHKNTIYEITSHGKFTIDRGGIYEQVS